MTVGYAHLSHFTRTLTRARMVLATLVLLTIAGAAQAAVHNVVLGAGYASASFVTPSTTQFNTGSASWRKLIPSAKAELYISPATTFGTTITVADIASITYHTRNHAAASPLEFYLAIYTKGAGAGPWAHGFYEQRLNGEPYLKTVQPYVQALDVWNAWTTGGADPLTFTDHNNAGNAGMYGGPTLAQVQAGPINWSTWPGTGPGVTNPAPIDYATQEVLAVSIQTGSGWSVFDGYLDDITVALTNGDSYVIDLEGAVDPLYVDDNWAAAGIGTEVVAGRFIGYNAFAKVQDAVNAAIPGGTINVAAGTYSEQVVVSGKNLSILGAGRASTTILSPTTLATQFTTSGPNKPVVFVQGTSSVTLRDLTVDADGQGNANNRIQGVAFWNAGGKLLDCDVLRVRNTPLDGAQAGVGVFGGTNTSAFALEVGGTRVLDFQKNGTVFTGAGYAVDLHDCTITGTGPTGVTAQNGIQISSGADGTVTNCAVAGTYYTGATFTATGQLFFDAGTVNVTGGSVAGCQTGTYYIDTDGQMLNTSTTTPFGGGIGAWGIATYNQAASLVAEARTGAEARPRPIAQPFEGDGTFARSGTNATTSLFTVMLDGGCVTGPGTAASEGIEVFTEGGGMSVSVSHMEITGWGYGIVADGTLGGPSVVADHNAIAGNITAGYLGGLGSHTAELNWWGNAGGPGVGGANPVVGAVDVTPRLIVGSDSNPGCGFAPPADNTVTPVSPVTCITPAPENSCVQVPVNIARTSSVGLRAFSVDVQLSAGLTLCAAVDEGTYLSGVGATQFQVVSNGAGSYTIDCSILGLPCGATAATGTLFTLNLGSALPSGTGTVTLSAVTLRDCANGPVPGSAGAAASISIDNTPPGAIAALTAAQQHLGNDGDGSTKINLSWPAVEAGASVLVYRKGFGFYPEYDDLGGVAPATPTYPPAGWTPVGTVTGPTTFADETTVRDFYYYVAFVRDACGNVSGVSNRTNGTLNYHLGDVEPVAGPLRGNNVVNTSDVANLGLHYGITLTPSDPLNYLDVGPTTDFSTNARPTTDNRVQFEDLIMFAINYGTVSAPSLAAKPAGKAGVDGLELQIPELPAVGENFAVGLDLSSAGTVKGLSVQLAYDPAVVEPVGVEAGELLALQHAPSAVLTAQPGNVDVAVLGAGEAIHGRGLVARTLFRVRAPGDAAIGVRSVLARDPDNRALPLGFVTTPLGGGTLPARTAMGPAWPNPFSRETTIELALRHEGEVSLAVYDLSGRRVARVLHGTQPAGVRLVKWDGRGDTGLRMAPGVYLMRLDAAGVKQTRRVLLVP